MHKVKELEKRWLYYKIKQVLIPTIKVSSLYLVVVGGYYMYDKSANRVFSPKMTNVLGVSMEANDSLVQPKRPTVQTQPKAQTSFKEEAKPVQEKQKIVLSPIIPVIDMEKEERIVEVPKKHKKIKKRKHSKPKHIVKAKRNAYLTAKELAAVSKPKKKIEVVSHRKTKKINFKSTSANYIQIMKQKFSKSKNPRDALLLAKAYYKKHQYRASEEWALSANKLDSKLEESWLLFAKSKAKLGKQKEALRILVSYYKKSHSSKAKRLIGQIKTGRI
jgi:hypothetical protein